MKVEVGGCNKGTCPGTASLHSFIIGRYVQQQTKVSRGCLSLDNQIAEPFGDDSTLLTVALLPLGVCTGRRLCHTLLRIARALMRVALLLAVPRLPAGRSLTRRYDYPAG